MSTTTTKLVAVSVAALLIGGLSYWVLSGSRQSVAPQSSPPPASTAAAPSAPPAEPPTPPSASMAAAPSAPPVTGMPAEADMSQANRGQIQEALRRLDYYKGSVDGNFGRRTRAAIRRFQHEIGADATGHLTAGEANRLVTSR